VTLSEKSTVTPIRPSQASSKKDEAHPHVNRNRLVRREDLPTVFGITWGDTRLWMLCRDGKFPKPIKLPDGKRGLAWLYGEVEDWILARAAERETTPAE
jgi:predicted DNA-binding transcriptional regulator AlpA